MAAPFIEKPLCKQTGLQGFLGQRPKENAIIELNNLLARADAITDVSTQHVSNISRAYGVNFHRQFKGEMDGFLREYIIHCLSDQHLAGNEIAQIRHLQQILSLPKEDAEQVYNEAARAVYRSRVDEAIADGRLSQQEKDFLRQIAASLGISEGETKAIYGEKAEALIQSQFDIATEDKRLSPEEEAELNEIAESLGINIEFEDEESQAALDRMRLYWQIEYGTIPVIPVSINLKRGEQCHFTCDMEWYEYRRVRTSIGYSGPTARLKIARGLYWRMGNVSIQPVSRDELTFIESGRLYLTGKRILFMGSKRNVTLSLSSVLDFTPHADGVEIKKGVGKNPFLIISDGESIDTFCLILQRLLGG